MLFACAQQSKTGVLDAGCTSLPKRESLHPRSPSPNHFFVFAFLLWVGMEWLRSVNAWLEESFKAAGIYSPLQEAKEEHFADLQALAAASDDELHDEGDAAALRQFAMYRTSASDEHEEHGEEGQDEDDEEGQEEEEEEEEEDRGGGGGEEEEGDEEVEGIMGALSGLLGFSGSTAQSTRNPYQRQENNDGAQFARSLPPSTPPSSTPPPPLGSSLYLLDSDVVQMSADALQDEQQEDDDNFEPHAASSNGPVDIRDTLSLPRDHLSVQVDEAVPYHFDDNDTTDPAATATSIQLTFSQQRPES